MQRGSVSTDRIHSAHEACSRTTTWQRTNRDTSCSRISGLHSKRRARRARGDARYTAARAATASVDSSTTGTQLDSGMACAQGPRDTMEDELCIIPEVGDYFYAGVLNHASAAILHVSLPSS